VRVQLEFRLELPLLHDLLLEEQLAMPASDLERREVVYLHYQRHKTWHISRDDVAVNLKE
jgi:hypothetical protein